MTRRTGGRGRWRGRGRGAEGEGHGRRRARAGADLVDVFGYGSAGILARGNHMLHTGSEPVYLMNRCLSVSYRICVTVISYLR